MRHAPFGRPRHPLGTFPCGKVPRPPAGGRNLSQVTDFLWMARERPSLYFPVLRRISPLRRRPKGFPVALWKPSGPSCGNGKAREKNRFLVEGKEKELPCFSVLWRVSPLRRRPGGFPLAPWTPSGPLCSKGVAREKNFLWKARERPSLLFPVLQRVSPLRRRPKGFPIALWKPSGPLQQMRIVQICSK